MVVGGPDASHPDARPPARGPRRLWADRGGAAGLEMSLVMLILMMFVVGIMEVGYTFYVQQALDYALFTAVRQVATGQLQLTATSLATFQSVAFCPAVAPFLSCSKIAVTVTPIAAVTSGTLAVPMKNGSFNPSGYTYCPGLPGELVMAQAVYPAASFLQQYLSGGLTTYNGKVVRLISSNAGFVNEPFTAIASPPPGC